jgi:hypothetical protein
MKWMIRDLVTDTEPYCQSPKRRHFLIVYIMLVSVMLIAFSFSFAFAQFSNPVKTLSFRSYIDDIDNFHVVGEIQNDLPSAIRYVIVIATFYNMKNQEVGTLGALTTPMDIGSGAKAPFDLTAGSSTVPIREIANYSIMVSHQ